MCQFVWAAKTIALQTWKASCKSEPSYEVCPQCRKPFRKFLSFYKQRGRSHARILRPSSSHKLDIILIALELLVSIYCETVIQLCVRRFHSYPPHLFTFYLTHAHFVFFNVRSAISPRLQFYKSLTIKESFKGKYSTCKTSAGIEFYKRNPFNFFLRSPSIFKRNPIKKNRLQFYMEIPLLFSKNHKLETIFEKSHRSSVILKILENFSNLSKI